MTLLYNRLKLIILYVYVCILVCIFHLSLSSFTPHCFSNVSNYITCFVEIVSKRHFWERGINWQSGGSILWPWVCCDLEMLNCLHFYKPNLSTHFGVKFIAGYMLAVASLWCPKQRIFPLPLENESLLKNARELHFHLSWCNGEKRKTLENTSCWKGRGEATVDRSSLSWAISESEVTLDISCAVPFGSGQGCSARRWGLGKGPYKLIMSPKTFQAALRHTLLRCHTIQANLSDGW